MSISIKSDCRQNGKPLSHFWSFCVGAGRANEGLRANWQKQLRFAVKECGFKYIRFHGIFHDDMFVYGVRNGKEIYNFQYVDELFDSLLDIGIKPFIEFSFCPKQLASGDTTNFWWKCNSSPPNNYRKWHDLIYKFTKHCIERYGIKEARKWYFEVWNEPNLYDFFSGTKSRYFELYKTTALALKKLDKKLKVGGPATSNFVPDSRFDGEQEDKSKQLTLKTKDLNNLKWKGVWIEDFLDYCHTEKLPVDFISTHPYPTDFALDNSGTFQGRTRCVESTLNDLSWLRDIVLKSKYPDAEIHLTEWSSSPSSRDFSHDYLQAATFIAKTNIESTGLVDSLSYWTFSDIFEEAGAGPTIFHGGFGMINFQCIVKPVFHAYRFLNFLGDIEIARSKGIILTRNSKNKKISLLSFHYPEEILDAIPMSVETIKTAEKILNSGKPSTLKIQLSGIKPNTRFIIETLDRNHGFAFKKYLLMGSPDSPTKEQVSVLRESGLGTKQEYIYSGNSGSISIKKRIAPWTLISIREL